MRAFQMAFEQNLLAVPMAAIVHGPVVAYLWNPIELGLARLMGANNTPGCKQDCRTTFGLDDEWHRTQRT